MKPKIILKLSVMVIFTIVVFSCSKQTPPGEIKTINILELKKGELNISEIADDITYIPLSNDSMLDIIRDVKYSSGEFFINDRYNFFRFNEKGKLLNKIGNRGDGPGEYRFVSDFIIQPETRDIFITGGKQDQIMVYSPDGYFIRSFELTRQHISAIGMSEKNILAFFFYSPSHDTINMYLLDFNGKVLKNFKNKYEFERGRTMVAFVNECLMYKFGQKLHFKEIFSDTIFYMDGQEMIPHVILNSGDRRFTPEVRSEIISELSVDINARSEGMVKSLFHTNLFETQNYLFFAYNYDGEGRFLVCNKSTGEQVEINAQQGIINDLDGGPNIQLKKSIDDNTLVSWIDAFELKMYVESDDFKNSTPKYPEKKKELEQLANSLDENDNPVLMLIKLKE